MTQYIIFTAGIQKEQVSKLRQAITESVNNGITEIHLAISSVGGDVFEGLSIAALIKSTTINVITHNIGQIDSVANVIFAAGKKRFAISNSSFLFHGVTANFQNISLTENQIKEQYENIKRLRGAISDNFASYIGIPVADVNTLMANGSGSILTASEALVKTIIHEIKDFVIPQGVKIITIGNA